MSQIKRVDGRFDNQIRPIETEQGLLNKADGSAKFTQNKSSVLAAVYGPIEVKSARKEKILKSVIEVTFTPGLGNTNYQDKEKELLIRNAVESVILTTLHPRTQITIVIQVYSDDGSIISCAINAVCLALLDAGIEMNGMIGSVTLAYQKIDDQDVFYFDPDLLEEIESKAVAIFAFGNNSNNIIMSKVEGKLTEELYFLAIKNAREATDKIIAFMKLAVKNRIMGNEQQTTTTTQEVKEETKK